MRDGDPYDCGDFTYRVDAQKVYDRHPGDPYGLDAGHDGVACEGLPHRPNAGGRPAGDRYAPKTPPPPTSPRA